MNPEESTNTATLRTRRHTSRHLKLRKPRPYTSLIDTEDSEIFRLNIRHVAFVRNGQRTPFQIVQPASVVLFRRRIRADVVLIVDISDIATLGRSKKGCGAFVASDFSGSRFSNWEFKKVSWIRRVGEMIVEPPLLEDHVLDRSNGSIVIGKGLLGDIEAEHTGMEHSSVSRHLR